MSGFPFPADRQAAARMDWCAPSIDAAGCSDALSCTLRARQCGSHIQATGDQAWAARAGPALEPLVAHPALLGWSRDRACPQVAAAGVCHLLTATGGYGGELWDAFGRARESAAYEAIVGSTRPRAEGAEGEREDGPDERQPAVLRLR